MSRRIPRPINEWNASLERKKTVARFQALEGRTITGSVTLPSESLGSWSAWNIVEFANDNGLTASSWSEIFTALQAVEGFNDGDEVLFPSGEYSSATSLTITRPMKLTGRGAVISSTALVKLIEIKSSNVHIDGMILQGQTASTYNANSAGFRCVSPSTTERYQNILIENCEIYDSGSSALEFEFVSNVKVSDCHIDRYARSGLRFLSCENGSLEGNLIENGMNGAGNPSVVVYPIMMSRQTINTIAVYPRCRNFVVRDNVIVNNPWWEGIDTHSGENLMIENNWLFNVLQPIAIVSSANELGVDSYAARNVVVRGNYMDSLRDDGAMRAGIIIDGSGTVTGSVTQASDGVVVSNNIVRRHGTQNNSLSGGITIFRTRGCVVSANTVIECSPHGINVANDNKGFNCSNNTIVDSWTTNLLTCSAVCIASFFNTGLIMGNVLSRGAKVATLVNNRGLSCTSSLLPASHNNRVILGPNDFDAATDQIGPAGVLNNALGSVKFGFAGVYAERATLGPALTVTATGTEISTTVNSIRTALKDKLGLTI